MSSTAAQQLEEFPGNCLVAVYVSSRSGRSSGGGDGIIDHHELFVHMCTLAYKLTYIGAVANYWQLWQYNYY